MRTDTIQALTRFKSLKELADYSHDTGLIYPLNEARGNEILKHLLRKIGSRKWNSRGGGGGGGKKDGGKQGTGKVKTGGAGKST